MRTAFVVSTVAIGALVAGCRTSPPIGTEVLTKKAVPSPLGWSPRLGLHSLAQIPQRLKASFDDTFDAVVQTADGKLQHAPIATCDAYLRLRPDGYEPFSEPDLAAFRIQGATCQTLKALQTARPPSAEGAPAPGLDARFLGALPATMGPAVHPADRDRREAAASARKSWAAVDPEARLKVNDAWMAQVAGKDWSSELEILGRADFDGDGRDDLLVKTVATGAEGSWTEIRLRLLSRPAPQGPLSVTHEYRL